MEAMPVGMFDYVKCEAPLPDGWEAGALQTKDFDCTMMTVTITKDGRLVSDNRDWWRRDDPKPVDLEFHGKFRFYGYEGERPGTPGWHWHEYEAKFTDGQLVEITPSPSPEIVA